MNTIVKSVFLTLCLIAFGYALNVYGAVDTKKDLMQGIIDRDEDGRIKVMRVNTERGSCWA